jgi:hypothetical protein
MRTGEHEKFKKNRIRLEEEKSPKNRAKGNKSDKRSYAE